MKISEFAKLANTTRRTLIFYDEKGLFSPAKTGENGYRYYEADQLYQFQMIAGLRQLGLSLEEIADLLESEKDLVDEKLGLYQEKIQEQILHLEMLNHLLEIRKKKQAPYQNLDLKKVVILSEAEKAFWCTDLAVDCQPEDVAKLYAGFMNDLGEVTNQVPSQLGFLTSLEIAKYQDYMKASFRFIKEETTLDSRNLMTRITKPAGAFLSIKVEASLDGILEGLAQLQQFVAKKGLQVDDFLWQLNTDQDLIKNGSSAYQVLQYRMVEGEE